MYPTIVSPDWLQENMQNQDVRVFDVTFFENHSIEQARHLFAKEHIANSTQLLLRGKEYMSDFFNKVPKDSTFSLLATKQGFSRGTHAVLYDRDGRSAIRCWWLFQYFNYIKVSILQGGFDLWQNRNFGVQKKQIDKLQECPQTAFSAQPRNEILVQKEQLKELLQKSNIIEKINFPEHIEAIQQYEKVIDQKQVLNQLNIGDILKENQFFNQIIDCRSNEQFEDEKVKPLPGAIHVDFNLFIKDKMLLTDCLRIKQILRENGVDQELPSLLYGEDGFQTCIMALVMFLSSGRGIRGISILKESIKQFYDIDSNAQSQVLDESK